MIKTSNIIIGIIVIVAIFYGSSMFKKEGIGTPNGPDDCSYITNVNPFDSAYTNYNNGGAWIEVNQETRYTKSGASSTPGSTRLAQCTEANGQLIKANSNNDVFLMGGGLVYVCDKAGRSYVKFTDTGNPATEQCGGAEQCEYGLWGPSTETQCQGVPMQQTRQVTSGGPSCTDTTRQTTGTQLGGQCGGGNNNPCNLPWGGQLAHGGLVASYSVGSVAFGQSCPASQQLSCNNGVLSNGNQYASCTVAPTTCTHSADTNHDCRIDRGEVGAIANIWVNGGSY